MCEFAVKFISVLKSLNLIKVDVSIEYGDWIATKATLLFPVPPGPQNIINIINSVNYVNYVNFGFSVNSVIFVNSGN